MWEGEIVRQSIIRLLQSPRPAEADLISFIYVRHYRSAKIPTRLIPARVVRDGQSRSGHVGHPVNRILTGVSGPWPSQGELCVTRDRSGTRNTLERHVPLRPRQGLVYVSKRVQQKKALDQLAATRSELMVTCCRFSRAWPPIRASC